MTQAGASAAETASDELAAPAVPGAQLLKEIREQPDVLRALVGHAAEYEAVAGQARSRGLTIVRLVGHGSSDNAASFAVYAFGLLPRWTALRDVLEESDL